MFRAIFALAVALSASPAIADFLLLDDLSHDGDAADAVGRAAQAFARSTARADAHAPIGVMADHTHKIGEVMLSYRHMFMQMDGSRDGTSAKSDADVRSAGFAIVPTEMTMEMHMFGVMYAPRDWVTLMLMAPYVRKTMKHKAGPVLGAVQFDTVSEGLGDIKLSAMFPFWERGAHAMQFNFGISFPTGSIAEKDATPAGRVTLPYPMQLGSGTVDVLPGVGYTYQAAHWSAGAQASAVLRVDENYRNYTLGNRFDVTGWWAYRWVDGLTTSVRLDFQAWGDIDGFDSDLPPAPFPASTMDPDLQAGERLDLLFGINLHGHHGWAKGHRIAIEGGVPIYQRLDGPRLETDWIITVGWQYAF